MLDVDLVEVPGTAPRIKSTFEVVGHRPLALDMTTVDQRDQSVLKTKAIFRFEGSTLTYCVGAPGQPRPTTFETLKGDGKTLVVLRRFFGSADAIVPKELSPRPPTTGMNPVARPMGLESTSLGLRPLAAATSPAAR